MRGSAYEYETKPWKARTCEIIEDMGAEDVGGDSRWLSKSGNTDSVPTRPIPPKSGAFHIA